MAIGAEVPMSLATALLLLGPAAVLWRAWARTRGRRALLAALALTSFFATDFALASGSAVGLLGGEDAAELVELVGDLVTASLFAAAFLLPGPRHAA
jgi:hypothetical protein